MIGSRHTVFNVAFKVLISSASHRFVVTGGPHPGCAPDYGGNAKYGHDNFTGNYLRGQTSRSGSCPEPAVGAPAPIA